MAPPERDHNSCVVPRSSVVRRALLTFEAAVWLLAARLVVTLVPFEYLAAQMSRQPRRRRSPPGVESDRTIDDVRRAIAAAAARIPAKFLCLPRAVATQAMLRRRGQPTTIYFGVAKDAADGLLIHAWLQCGQRGVVGHETAGDYQVVAQYSAERSSSTPGLAQ